MKSANNFIKNVIALPRRASRRAVGAHEDRFTTLDSGYAQRSEEATIMVLLS